ncbi:MAG: TIGR02300 family protein [Variibacter sp.]
MAKPELGTKRLCPHCGAKFYDLGKDPIVCPKCGSEVEIAPLPSRGRPDARTVADSSDEAEPAEAQGAEMVSLEEADAEASGKKSTGTPDVDVDVDEDVDDDAEDDSTFLEETDDENDDVSDIIGSDIEDEEES